MERREDNGDTTLALLKSLTVPAFVDVDAIGIEMCQTKTKPEKARFKRIEVKLRRPSCSGLDESFRQSINSIVAMPLVLKRAIECICCFCGRSGGRSAR